jgi:hypothetical protein
MVQVIERGEGYYESRDVEAGRVYEWRPEHVVAECGTDYTPIIHEGFAARRPPENENPHPWRSLHYFAYAGALCWGASLLAPPVHGGRCGHSMFFYHRHSVEAAERSTRAARQRSPGPSYDTS